MAQPQARAPTSTYTSLLTRRAADNLARLNDSLVSLLAQKNHLRPAGQGPVAAGTMLLERLSSGFTKNTASLCNTEPHNPNASLTHKMGKVVEFFENTNMSFFYCMPRGVMIGWEAEPVRQAGKLQGFKLNQ
ncbi:hypothetical protein DV515_00006406 [Chloebia gouldiae]|uniref:Uncharacterized protein n=1 Tax=Chloebia gouldiae TaxID=44316 RepID=A0A3L8SLV7_CHLGU|nr:hypothetical protein DV515_00006406 [Chloebia gouldiae]